MKKRIELDVDTIGEQGRGLTKEEDEQISAYIREQKAKQNKKVARKRKAKAARKKTTA